jgi:hypothetical protein
MKWIVNIIFKLTKINSETIICDNYEKLSEIKLSYIIYIYEYKCCYIKCLNSLKTKDKNIEKSK